MNTISDEIRVDRNGFDYTITFADKSQIVMTTSGLRAECFAILFIKDLMQVPGVVLSKRVKEALN